MTPKCLVCNSVNSIPLKTGNKDVNHFICKDCGLIYIWPFQTKSSLESFYEGDDSSDAQGVKLKSHKKTQQMISEGVLDEAKSIIKNSGLNNLDNKKKILEIGSSKGNLLNAFKLEGFDVLGIEPSKLAAKHSKQNYNFPVINNIFENVEIKSKFDLVLCIHMLEHVNNPIEFLSKIKNVLNDQGILYIKVSNLYKPIVSLKRFFIPLHLITYSPKTLIDMLALNKFKAININTKGPYIEMFFVKDSETKLNIDSNECNNELKFLKKYQRDYFFKLNFLKIFFKEKIYTRLVNLFVRLVPFSWSQKIRRILK